MTRKQGLDYTDADLMEEAARRLRSDARPTVLIGDWYFNLMDSGEGDGGYLVNEATPARDHKGTERDDLVVMAVPAALEEAVEEFVDARARYGDQLQGEVDWEARANHFAKQLDEAKSLAWTAAGGTPEYRSLNQSQAIRLITLDAQAAWAVEVVRRLAEAAGVELPPLPEAEK